MLYPISNVSGIRTLVPKISTHGKPYVYAIRNLSTGLLFGAKQDDFDFNISTDKDGKPTISECYPKAFEKAYKGKSCSVYLLKEDGFREGMTGWSEELVCENPVNVDNEIHIEDLYTRLLKEQHEGNLIIKFYEDTKEYKSFISEHIVDRLIRFDALDSSDSRLQQHYGAIIAALKEVMNGHLL